MVSGDHAPIDAHLDAFIAAWHAGQAPTVAAALEAAADADREPLAVLLTAFLELAPTVPRAASETDAAAVAAASALDAAAVDPLLEQIAEFER